MSEVNFTALPVDLTQSHESSYIVRISTNVISRAIYAPKIVFCVYGTRFSRAYDTHFLLLPTLLPPKPTQGVFSA